MLTFRIILLLTVCCGILSLRAEPDGAEFFEKKIRPLLAERCFKCHSHEATSAKGGLYLDTKEGLFKGGENGSILSPGEPDKSKLISAIRYSDENLQMPPKSRLSPAEVALVEDWVRMGAPVPEASNLAGQAQEVAKRNHWSFQPLRPVIPPRVDNVRWPKSGLDQFILKQLEKNRLSPSLPADRRTLIRRATYDLHGLPPTADETEAFEKDTSPNAYRTLLERLLASPRYGEKWGRFWLDVARYADTKGYVYGREETRFIHSATYRDWVIHALNEDMPYDRFIALQIAADQLVPESDPDQAAMGFLTVGRRFLGVVHDIIDDRMDVVMRGTQGLTVGCARCHDHKFDPISTKEYYSLYGIFAGSYEKQVPLQTGLKKSVDFEKGLQERIQKLDTTYLKKREALTKHLRTQTGMYLKAVLNAANLPTEEFYEIRGPDDLNPIVARQWQSYIAGAIATNHPVFAAWNQLVNGAFPVKVAEGLPGNALIAKALRGHSFTGMVQVAEIYGSIFKEVNSTELKPEQKTSTDPAAEEIRQILYGTDSPASVPQGSIVDMEWFFDEPARVELSQLQAEIDKFIISSPGAPRYSVLLCDKLVQRNPRVFKRGNPANKGDEVQRGFLAILSGGDRRIFKSGSGRLDLARAIADPKNPLTARVMVNRIWMQHFGAGLVRTPSDFGLRSDPPTHPELLDWLAQEFIRGNWSIKNLHRLIMLSSTYQQGSDPSADAELRDPENRLLSHLNRRRLDFEGFRDSLLSVSGRLELAPGGKPKPLDAANPRRTVYAYIDRQFLPGVLRLFDFANPDLHSPQRLDTTVPQQALFFMNGPFVIERSRGVARSIARNSPEHDSIRALYRRIYQRSPTPEELARGISFLKEAKALPQFEHPEPPPPAWEYGYAFYDESAHRITNFHKLPYFDGTAWQGGASWPDAKLGWVRLTAQGGHAGNDLQHAAVRRWVSPMDGMVQIAGSVTHDKKEGDGIRARIVSSRTGPLGVWPLQNATVETSFKDIEVKNGDIIDFVVDFASNLNNDDFTWNPVIKAGMGMADGKSQWESKRDFSGPAEKWPAPLSPLEQYAHALLLSNEFAFVD